MRETPWHLRIATTEHHHWFRNLVDFHDLTNGWVHQVQQEEKQAHTLTRGLSAEVTENLWMLDSLAQTALGDLLDDTLPGEMLGRLEHTIWAVQSWTVGHLHAKAAASNRSALDSQLEQFAWKQGRKSAETRWPDLAKKGRQDLRDILLALMDSPFAGYPTGDGFLVKRATSEEIQIELRACPHQSRFQEVKSVADRMCRFHAHWMRGYAYALNNKVAVEHVVQPPRCTQRWYFI